ncbi:MAG: glycosyltransferase [Chloroflexi bacterium]|nr:glycosyltransferase [Chloroflexota bacterium]
MFETTTATPNASAAQQVGVTPPTPSDSVVEASHRRARQRIAAWFDRFAGERAAWRARNRYYYDEIECLAQATIPPGSRVLELGCGIGDLLAAVRPSFGVGVDLSEQMLKEARSRHARPASAIPAAGRAGQTGQVTRVGDGILVFVRGDAQELPLNTKFDYVICSDLLGHVNDIQALLDRLHAVCTPETKVLITYWNFAWQAVLSAAERFGLKMPQGQQNWLGMTDVDNILLLTDFATLQRGTSLLLPKPVPVLAPLFNRWIMRLPFLSLMGLATHWVVKPAAGRRQAEALRCTVIVPCRNEAGNIADCIDRLPDLGTHTEVIFVDGASTDGTRERILEQIAKHTGSRDIKLLDQVPDPHRPPPPECAPFAATTVASTISALWSAEGGRLPDGLPAAPATNGRGHNGKAGASEAAGRPGHAGMQTTQDAPVKMLRLGKGDAVRKGFAAASGDVLFILDADLTVPPEELPKFLEPIATGKADFVNGTRLVYPLEDEAMGFHRLLGNKFFSVVFTWLLGQPIKDTLCGTKVMRKRDYEVLAANRSYFGDFDPFGDFDILFGAARLGLRIVEVPVRYRRRTSGYSKVQVLEHGPLLLRMSLIGFRRLKLARWLGRSSQVRVPASPR